LPESATFCGRKLKLRQQIPAHWWLKIERRGKGKREEGVGLYRRVLDGHYCEILLGGSNSDRFQEREGEEFLVKENLTRGSHRSARKKRKGKRKREGGLLGWFGADQAGWVPGAAQLGCAPFFFVLIHFPFSIFCFSLFFISFASVIQMTSKQTVQSSEIRLNILRQ
jgi:hypothetical protein